MTRSMPFVDSCLGDSPAFACVICFFPVGISLGVGGVCYLCRLQTTFRTSVSADDAYPGGGMEASP